MNPDLKSIQWHLSYKTSASVANDKPVDILHDFYIPALKRSTRYDRVAGYFRSSSLAAASQGFSAFSAAGGKMRLVVGADLQSDDVAAILKGDQERLAAALEKALNPNESWPADVQNGVALLGRMVARGVIEVRVAFRVHGKTGQPLPCDSAEDGYVHEKWALFTDAAGHRLYISGSLNESRTALMHNAENIDVHADWWNDLERRRADEAAHGFERLWQDRHPHLRVLTLPEAVRRRLIALGTARTRPSEIDGTTAAQPQVPPPSALEWLQFAILRDGPRLPGGRWVGLETAPVAPWPHQEVVARRLIETWPYSYLLCDEVGLGKTIEAGLAIRSLVLSGLVKRVLIAPPASLTRQWQREMATKFLLPFARALSGGAIRHETLHPIETQKSANNLYAPDLCIVSTGLLSRKERRDQLKAADPFDIVLVDEAHYARRANPKNGQRTQPKFGHLYRTIANQLRKRTPCLWLATATPMQMDWIEVFDLLGLTRRVGAFQHDPSITWAYYQALGQLVQGANIEPDQWELLRNAILSVKQQDPFLWQHICQAVIDGQIAVSARKWLNHGISPTGIDRKKMPRLIFSASPLARVMLRHTRPLLEIYRQKGQLKANLATREILPVPKIVLAGLEKQIHDELEAYCGELVNQIVRQAHSQNLKTSIGFYLSFLRLRLASSLYAIRETLKRRRDKVNATLAHQQGRFQPEDSAPLDKFDMELDDEPEEDIINDLLKGRDADDLEWEAERLDRMLTLLADISAMPLKMRELMRVLENRKLAGHRVRQTVIFTRFFDTLSDLVERMRHIDAHLLIGTYSGKGGQYVDPRSGKLQGTDRDEIKKRFLKGDIDILVCTDAAAEGLNLQTADLLINYDLPWNPMKVEQRIGRIDRIGQKHDRIEVLNLCYANSAEQIVYERLLQRLVQAGYVVGMQQISMLPVTREEFNELAAGHLSAETLEARAKERIEAQKQQTASMEISAQDLFDIYMRMQSRADRMAPVTLSAIWQTITQSTYLRHLGCIVSTDINKPTVSLSGLRHIPENTLITTDRDLFEKELPDPAAPLYFASYGDPVFDNLLAAFADYDIPPCIVRLTEPVSGTKVEVIAYAAACLTADGSNEIRLITCWQQLQGLHLDESVDIQETHLTAVREALHEMVRLEFEPTRSVDRIENNNQIAAQAQMILNLLIADRSFPPFGKTESDGFWPAVSEWDQILETRDKLIVPKINAELLRKIQPILLCEIPVPRAGDETDLSLPVIQVAAAIDAACRIADSLKIKKSDVTIDQVKRGIITNLGSALKLYNKLSVGG
jgi:superfamily II DNA or RNA helicase